MGFPFQSSPLMASSARSSRRRIPRRLIFVWIRETDAKSSYGLDIAGPCLIRLGDQHRHILGRQVGHICDEHRNFSLAETHACDCAMCSILILEKCNPCPLSHSRKIGTQLRRQLAAHGSAIAQPVFEQRQYGMRLLAVTVTFLSPAALLICHPQCVRGKQRWLRH